MTVRGSETKRQEHVIGLDAFTVPAATHTVAEAAVRARVVVEGTVGSTRSVAWAGGPVTEMVLADGTDLITLAFFGAHRTAGVHTGSRLVAAGAVVNHHGRRVLLNPQLWLRPAATVSAPSPAVGRSTATRHDRRVRTGPDPLVPALTAAAV